MKLKQLNKFTCINTNGFTLLSVLLLLMLITVLGVSILTVTANTLKFSSNERTDQSTFYIAEAGIVETRREIEGKVQEAYNFAYNKTSNDYDRVLQDYLAKRITKFEFDFLSEFQKNYTAKVKADLPTSWNEELKDFEPNFSENNTMTEPIASVSISRDSETTETLVYKIASVGKIGNKERTVTQKLTINLKVGDLVNSGTTEEPGTPEIPEQGGPIRELPEKTAILVKEKITMANGKAIGDMRTLQKSPESIVLSGNPDVTKVGSLYVPKGSENKALKKPNTNKEWAFLDTKVIGMDMGNIPELPPFPIPDTSSYDLLGDVKGNGWPSTSSLKMSSNKVLLGNVDISGGHILTIDIGDKDTEIVMDTLKVGGDGQIIFKGTGKLILHVKNNLNLLDGRDRYPLKVLSGKKTEIYYSGKTKLNFAGNIVIDASIYAETADVDISGSGKIFGNILSGGTSFKVTGDGNATSSLYYFAPNARFEVSGSGKVKGTIIGKSINISGTGSVEYGELQYDTWVPGTPSTPEIPGIPPTKSENPDLIKREPLVEI